MAHEKNHDYHILEPDIWPLFGWFSALTFTSGMVLSFHPVLFGTGSSIVMWAVLVGLLATFYMWFRNIVI